MSLKAVSPWPRALRGFRISRLRLSGFWVSGFRGLGFRFFWRTHGLGANSGPCVGGGKAGSIIGGLGGLGFIGLPLLLLGLLIMIL